MKLNIKTLALVTGLFLMASCSNDDERINDSNEVKFQIDIAGLATRVTTSTDFKSTFDEGDAIGIYAKLDDSEYATNAKYIKQNDGTWTSTDGIVLPPTGTLSFYAYYPYQENNSLAMTAIPFDVTSDQSEGVGTYDLLATSATNVDAGNNEIVKLTFGHQLALVQLTVQTSNSGVSLDTELSGVSLNNALTQMSFDLSSLSCTNVSTASSIAMKKISGDVTAAVYWAIVPPQTITSGTVLVSLQHNSSPYVYTLGSDLALEKNKVQKITLTLDTGGSSLEALSLASSSVATWGYDEAAGANSDNGEDVDLN